jgi:hypothetical protein
MVQVILPVGIALATIFIPLQPITSDFSINNMPFITLYLPALSLNYALMQYPWYHQLCFVQVTQLRPAVVYIASVVFVNAVPMWMNKFPQRLYPGLSLVGLWLTVLPLLISIQG